MITLKTLPQATSQQVFDHVVNHLLTQNEKAGVVGGEIEEAELGNGCRYRLNNLKCAAGCLIGDEEYRGTFEGFDWKYLVETSAVPDAHSELIVKLQRIHDDNEPEEWPYFLKQLAESEGLTFNWRTNDNT